MVFAHDKDAVCFVEKVNFVPKQKLADRNTNRRLFGEVITNTEESKINIKVFVKINKNLPCTTIKQFSGNSLIKDIFHKIATKQNGFKYRNIDLYYMVAHSEDGSNENMDEALNMDLEIQI